MDLGLLDSYAAPPDGRGPRGPRTPRELLRGRASRAARLAVRCVSGDVELDADPGAGGLMGVAGVEVPFGAEDTSLGASLGASLRGSLRASLGASLEAALGAWLGASLRGSLGAPLGTSLKAAPGASLGASRASPRASLAPAGFVGVGSWSSWRASPNLSITLASGSPSTLGAVLDCGEALLGPALPGPAAAAPPASTSPLRGESKRRCGGLVTLCLLYTSPSPRDS